MQNVSYPYWKIKIEMLRVDRWPSSRKLCLLCVCVSVSVVCVSDTNTPSHGVTNATVGAALCFPFHTSQLFTQCLQPLLTSVSSLFFSSYPTVFIFFLSVALSPVSTVMEWLSYPGSACATGACVVCLALPIIVPVTAVSPALAVLHIQVGKFISARLDLFAIGCFCSHCSAMRTDTQGVNDPGFR